MCCNVHFLLITFSANTCYLWWLILTSVHKCSAVTRLLGGLLCHTFPHFALFFPPFISSYDIMYILLLELTCVSLFQQISFEWCYGVFFPLFSVFSNPSWSRCMATLPESGSARGFFLLKGSRFSPQSPRACSGWGIRPKSHFGAICWFT